MNWKDSSVICFSAIQHLWSKPTPLSAKESIQRLSPIAPRMVIFQGGRLLKAY